MTSDLHSVFGLNTSNPDGLDRAIDAIPLTDDPIASLDLPSDEAGEMTGVHARVPIAWLEQMDAIRQLPGTRMPDVWKTRARLIRWCIYQGLMVIQQASARINEPDAKIDPILQARLFVEKTGGDLQARAVTAQETIEKLQRIGESVELDIRLGEHAEAARRVNQWIEGAYAQESPYWQRFFIKAISQIPQLADSVRTLITMGLVPDSELLQSALTMNADNPIPIHTSPPKPKAASKHPSMEDVFNL